MEQINKLTLEQQSAVNFALNNLKNPIQGEHPYLAIKAIAGS